MLSFIHKYQYFQSCCELIHLNFDLFFFFLISGPSSKNFIIVKVLKKTSLQNTAGEQTQMLRYNH